MIGVVLAEGRSQSWQQSCCLQSLATEEEPTAAKPTKRVVKHCIKANILYYGVLAICQEILGWKKFFLFSYSIWLNAAILFLKCTLNINCDLELLVFIRLVVIIVMLEVDLAVNYVCIQT